MMDDGVSSAVLALLSLSIAGHTRAALHITL